MSCLIYAILNVTSYMPTRLNGIQLFIENPSQNYVYLRTDI